jgi:hypothetical protein
MSNYPVINTGDVIVSSDDWEVWGVDTVLQTSHKGTVTKQVVNMTAFQGDDPKRLVLEHIRSKML